MLLWYTRFWRAFSKSILFIFIGFLLLFMSITKDTFLDWDTSYAPYVLIGCSLSLIIGSFLFLRNFAGPLSSKKNQEEDFLIKYIVPLEKRPYLAIGALYNLHPYRTAECLKSFIMQKPEIFDESKKNTKDFWGVTDAASAKEKLDFILYKGARNDPQYLESQEKIIAQLNGRAERTHEIDLLIEDANSIIFSLKYVDVPNDLIDPTAITNCTKISGWDYIRGVSWAQDFYNLGYLTEDEAWEYIIPFGKLVKEDFTSWEELAASFLVGRYIWSGDPVQEWCTIHFSWLFSYYHDNDVDVVMNNLWKKYSISDL